MKRSFLSFLLAAAAMILGNCERLQAGALFAVSGAGNGPSTLYKLDPSTGAVLTTVGPTGFSHITGLAFNPITGVLYGHQSDIYGSGATNLVTIDVITGVATLVGSTSIQSPDMSFDPSGNLYAWAEASTGGIFDQLVQIDPTTAAATPVGVSVVGTLNTGLAFNKAGTLYLKNFFGSGIFEINKVTGAATFVTAYSSALNNVLAFDTSLTLAYSVLRESGTSFLKTVDVTNGTVTLIGDIGVSGISALAFQPDPPVAGVPEPGSLAVWGIGIVAFAGIAWRKRQVPA